MTGDKVCIPLMDDLAISSATYAEHVKHVNMVLEAAGQVGFEFQLTKGRFNETRITRWG